MCLAILILVDFNSPSNYGGKIIPGFLSVSCQIQQLQWLEGREDGRGLLCQRWPAPSPKVAPTPETSERSRVFVILPCWRRRSRSSGCRRGLWAAWGSRVSGTGMSTPRSPNISSPGREASGRLSEDSSVSVWARNSHCCVIANAHAHGRCVMIFSILVKRLVSPVAGEQNMDALWKTIVVVLLLCRVSARRLLRAIVIVLAGPLLAVGSGEVDLFLADQLRALRGDQFVRRPLPGRVSPTARDSAGRQTELLLVHCRRCNHAARARIDVSR